MSDSMELPCPLLVPLGWVESIVMGITTGSGTAGDDICSTGGIDRELDTVAFVAAVPGGMSPTLPMAPPFITA